MNRKNILKYLTVPIFAVVFCECERLGEENWLDAGSEVTFGASTTWQNDLETRTEYSGKDQTNSTISTSSTIERIDWVANKDRIRIYSPQAVKRDGTTHIQDYFISEVNPVVSPDYQKHKASIKCVDPNGLIWDGTSEYHYFHALYPAPGTVSKYDGFTTYSTVPDPNSNATITPGSTANTAVVTGKVPATQEVYWNSTDQEYEPNMNYAIMYASARAKSTGSVTLSFHPLVSALTFNLKAGSSASAGYTLTGFKLSSTANTLAGSFTATLPAATSDNASPFNPATNISASGNSDEINLAFKYASGATVPTLATGSTIKVTVFMLPVSQSNLTVEMTFTKGGDTMVRTLDLNTRPGSGGTFSPITVAPCKKAYFNEMGVPGGITYTLDVEAPAGYIAQGGASATYKVKSTKSFASGSTTTTAGVAWTAEYSEDGLTWNSGHPSWITTFTDEYDNINGTGLISFTVEAAANNTSGWKGSTTVVGTSSAPRDLSCYDIYGNKTGGTEGSAPYNTANCYVVSAPGWYRFPIVYGNGYKNGSINNDAFRGPSGSNVLAGQFKKHDGGTIASDKPWIKDNTTVSKAVLLWQDVNGLISNTSGSMTISDNYVKFYVDPAKIAQGNALIAVQNSSSVTLWSWHIWVVDNPGTNLETKEVYTHPNYPSPAAAPNNHNGMLARNLGYCEYGVPSRAVLIRITQPESGISKTFSITQAGTFYRRMVHYQWGRKDPMWPIRINSTSSNTPDPYAAGQSEATWFNISGGSISWPGTSSTRSIAESIKNPNKFITGTDGYRWSEARYDNLWNTNVPAGGDASAQQRIVKKTIYDPCPPGFKVPDKNAFSGFSLTGTSAQHANFNAYNPSSVTTEEGYHFYLNKDDHSAGTIFIPFTGSRFPDNGKHFGMRVTNGWGDYATAAPMMRGSTDKALSYFTIHSSDLDPFAVQVRAFAYPVRAIADR